ncbi:brain tumor protein-like [Biomphalaria glabrata]|uniref:Brain tumor protein-like n=1 Tax=Biomphalaria glabrata TaxID=6526 RepID=A0A9W2ZQ71_BIOGL|nr:brain tumor protein-like [Biomphalaria glabrata]
MGNTQANVGDVTDEEMNETIPGTNPLNFCSSHVIPLPLNFFCQTCSIPICRDCIALEHLSSNGHEIRNLRQVLESSVDLFRNLDETMSHNLSSLQSGTSELVGRVETQVPNRDSLELVINETFNGYEEMLNQRKRILLEELVNRIAERPNQMQSEITRSQQTAEFISISLQNFRSAQETLDYRKIFDTYQKLQNSTQVLTERSIAQSQLLNPISFVNTGETDFVQAIQNLGEISE